MSTEQIEALEEEAIVRASRTVNVAAWYLMFVGLVGLVTEAPRGVLVLAVGAAVLGGAWLVRTYQSRLAAGVLFVGALLLFADRLQHEHGLFITAYLVMGAWVFGGAFALYATVRYHGVNDSAERRK